MPAKARADLTRELVKAKLITGHSNPLNGSTAVLRSAIEDWLTASTAIHDLLLSHWAQRARHGLVAEVKAISPNPQITFENWEEVAQQVREKLPQYSAIQIDLAIAYMTNRSADDKGPTVATTVPQDDNVETKAKVPEVEPNGRTTAEDSDTAGQSDDATGEGMIYKRARPTGGSATGAGGMPAESILRRWLEQLEALPPTDAVWDNTAAFVEAVRALTAKKAMEKQHTSVRVELDRKLAIVCERAAGANVPTTCDGWAASGCPEGRLDEAATLLDQFAALLDEYPQIEPQQPSTWAERRQRREMIAAMDARTEEMNTRLEALLRSPDASASPPVVSPPELAPVAAAAPQPASGTTLLATDPSSDVQQAHDAIPGELKPPDEATAALPEEPASATTGATLDDAPRGAVVDEAPAEVAEAIAEKIDSPASDTDGTPERSADAMPLDQDRPSAEPEALLGSVADDAVSLGAPPFASDEATSVAPSGDTISVATADQPLGPADKTTTTDSEGFLWKALASDDLDGGYWYARSKEASGEVPLVPSGVLAALIGSRALLTGGEVVEVELLEIFHEPRPTDDVAAALAVAAALLPALRSPATGAANWLEELSTPFETLNPIIIAVRQFAELQLPITPEDVNGQRNVSELDGRLRHTAADLRHSLEAAQHRSIVFGSDVLHALCASGGELAVALAPATADQRLSVDTLYTGLQPWHDRRAIENVIQTQHRAFHRYGRWRAIEGMALNQLIDNVHDIIGVADQWLQQASEWKTASGDQSMLHRRLDALSQALNRAIPAAFNALAPAPYQPIRHALAGVATFLSGNVPTEAATPRNSRGIDDGLSDRLLRYPDMPLDASPTGLPLVPDSGWQTLREHLTTYWPASDVATALTGWLARADFRFTERLLADIPEDERISLAERVDVARREAVQAALRDITAAEEQLEAGYADGSIGGAVRAQLGADLEAQRADTTVQAINVSALREGLAVTRQAIDLQREAPVGAYRESWDQVQKRLLTFAPVDLVNDAGRLIRAALDRHDQTVLNEVLPALQRATDRPSFDRALANLPNELASDATTVDQLIAFRAARTRFLSAPEGALRLSDLETRLRAGETPTVLSSQPLTQAQANDVAEALSAWQAMKTAGRIGAELSEAPRRDDHSLHLWRLMRFLSFHMRMDNRAAFSQRQFGRGWARWQGKMEAESANTVPQFGSDHGGTHEFLLLWERPGLARLDHVYREAGLQSSDPIIVMYLGRATDRAWQDFTRMAYRSRLQALLFDELLLLYLASIPGYRLDAFFACTLPTSHVNPFFPFAAGNTPPEAFVGREAMREALRAPRGAAILYGGRQLGKSSLLRQVERDFHAPDARRFAMVVDLRNVGDAGTPESAQQIWTRINDRWQSLGLPRDLAPHTANERPQTVLRRLRDEKVELLIMLDEADMFLTADQEGGFTIVSELKRFMDESQRRIKFVIAGLHNVRRTAAVPNQPFAHLGTPIVIGSLRPPEARALVGRLRLLGFQLDDHVLLKILGLTNYHPALLQLLCHHLVEHLRGDVLRLPPYTLTLADVERVANDPTLRGEFRDLFLWTLDLDPHYGVLTRAVIEQQLASPSGPSRTFTIADLRELGEWWWAAGFAPLSPDRFRTYLEELADLGVLVPLTDGTYQLRSPNLARLLGDKAELEEYLLHTSNLPENTVTERRVASEHRRPSTGSTPHYSPFSQGQLDRLGLQSGGVTLVFGTSATGLEAIPPWLTTLAGAANPRLFSFLHRDAPLSLGDPSVQARAMRTDLPNSSFPVLSVVLQGDAPALRRQVEAAFAIADHLGTGGGRVLLLGDAKTLASWLTLPAEEREDVEARTGCMVLERWHPAAITTVLADINVPHSPTAVSRLLEMTGGYHPLVTNFLQLVASQGKVNAALDSMTRAFDDESPLLAAIRADLLPPATERVATDLFAALCRRSAASEGGALMDTIADLVPGATDEEIGSAVLLLERLALLERRERAIVPVSLACAQATQR